LLDVLAGDLVAAGYAVSVGGEQDTDAVPGAGSDFGRRGAGGQPQRRRGMAKVVGPQARGARHGRSAAPQAAPSPAARSGQADGFLATAADGTFTKVVHSRERQSFRE